MKILALDSSSKTASVALLENGIITEDVFIDSPQTHSVTLMPAVSTLLVRHSLSVSDLNYIAVTAGPGSFTGVRIAMAAVKGLAAPYSIPCIAVSSLLAAAIPALDNNGIVCAVMDARRSQVYNANFRVYNTAVERMCDDRAISIDELYSELKQVDDSISITLTGDGAFMCYDILKEKGINNITAPESSLACVRAGSVAKAAFLSKETAVPPEKIALNYIRLSQAERELAQKQI